MIFCVTCYLDLHCAISLYCVMNYLVQNYLIPWKSHARNYLAVWNYLVRIYLTVRNSWDSHEFNSEWARGRVGAPSRCQSFKNMFPYWWESPTSLTTCRCGEAICHTFIQSKIIHFVSKYTQTLFEYYICS